MRTIREEAPFAEAIAKLKIDYQRLDEVMRIACDRLTRAPESYKRIPGTTLWCFNVEPYPGLPRLAVYYKFDEKEVWLIYADLEEEDEGG